MPVTSPTMTPTPTVTPTPTFIDNSPIITNTSVTVSDAVSNAVNTVADSKELTKALASDKDYIYQFLTNTGELAYSWKFLTTTFTQDIVTKSIPLEVLVTDSKSVHFKNGVHLSFAQTGILPCEARVKVYVGDYLKAGTKAYLYTLSKTSNKLLCVANSIYHVDNDGYVTIQVNHGDDYVLLPKAASSKEKTSVLDQVKIPKRASLSVLQKKRLSISLPVTLHQVSSLRKFDSNSYRASYGAVISYKSSNKKIATVSGTGTITAKKAGTVTITTTIKLSNGASKTYKTKFKIKK